MDVERNHVRARKIDRVQRLAAVAGKPDFEVGLSRKDLADQLADEGRVVDHEYLDHGLVCRVSLLRVVLDERIQQASFCTRQQFRGIEQQHDPA